MHRFTVPDGCHWRDARETVSNVGTALLRAMQEIERANPDTLYRVDGELYDRMAAEWREEQDRCLRQIEKHRSADRSYLDKGVRILELA